MTNFSDFTDPDFEDGWNAHVSMPRFTAAPVDSETERAAHDRAVQQEQASAESAAWLVAQDQHNGRHTVDTITSDALDQLYAELATIRGRMRLLDAMRQSHMDAACAAVQRAGRAEAAIERVRRLAACWQYTADRKHGPLRELRAALDEHQEQPTTGEQQAEDEQLVHIGWWCWRGDNHGHLVTSPCRSDNVPLHAPTEWADDMRAVIQRIEDGDDEEEQP